MSDENQVPTPEQMTDELLNIIAFLVETSLEEIASDKTETEKLSVIEANMNQVKAMFVTSEDEEEADENQNEE